MASGQIDIDAAYKNARFIRFCNLYNIPVIFMEDTTGFLPGREQETGGIVQAGRAMLDAIVDLRTPRFLVILRNAFGGAYAAFNNYPTGADFVIALPTTRVAVMGPAGVEFVYKDELRAIRGQRQERLAAELKNLRASGMAEEEAIVAAKRHVDAWVKAERGGARDALRARADEPERGAQPGLDLADRHALGPAQGDRGEPRCSICGTTRRSPSRAYSASSIEPLSSHLRGIQPVRSSNDYYLNNPLVHRDRRLGQGASQLGTQLRLRRTCAR